MRFGRVFVYSAVRDWVRTRSRTLFRNSKLAFWKLLSLFSRKLGHMSIALETRFVEVRSEILESRF
jgi:hypothetical protein